MAAAAREIAFKLIDLAYYWPNARVNAGCRGEEFTAFRGVQQGRKSTDDDARRQVRARAVSL